MSGKSTSIMLKAYEDTAKVNPFFLGLTKPVFHNQERVEWDVTRNGEVVAPVIEFAAGSNMNVADVYTNKEVLPPLYNEGFNLNAWALLGRDADQVPFEDNNFQAKAMAKILKGSRVNQEKVARALNLQVSQILNTGVVTIKDPQGNVAYTMDYKAKASHFPTVGTAWTGGAGNPIGDLQNLCDKVNEDGLEAPDLAIFGEGSFSDFMLNDEVKEKFNFRRADGVEILPLAKSGGANRRGYIDIGSFRLEIWTVNTNYQEKPGVAKIKFQPDNKVIVMSSKTRLDATYGSLPRIVGRDPRLAFVPERLSSVEGNFDLSFNAYVDNSGTNLTTTVGTRALVIPISIDTFGALKTDA